MEIEIWKDIEGCEGRYQVSNQGRVKSLDKHGIDIYGRKRFRKGKMLCNHTDTNGYLSVVLSMNGMEKRLRIHRLVADAFIGNLMNLATVNHKDGIKINNNDTNLEYCTNRENSLHAVNTGLMNCRGENSVNAKLTNQQVEEIRKLCGILPQWKIGEMFGVSQYNVSLIKQNKRFKKL